MNAIDPCGTSPVSETNVAALVIGRSMTRFVYYLSQSVLLSTGESVPEGQISSWTYAGRVLQSINARSAYLGLDCRDEISNLLYECYEEITGSQFGARCRDAVDWLNNNDQEEISELQNIVNQFAIPW
jgi:hypothetical protein